MVRRGNQRFVVLAVAGRVARSSGWNSITFGNPAGRRVTIKEDDAKE